MNEEKKCCRCEQTKELTQFVASRVHQDGTKAFCKECHSNKNKEWRKNNTTLNRALQKADYYKRKVNTLLNQNN